MKCSQNRLQHNFNNLQLWMSGQWRRLYYMRKTHVQTVLISKLVNIIRLQTRACAYVNVHVRALPYSWRWNRRRCWLRVEQRRGGHAKLPSTGVAFRTARNDVSINFRGHEMISSNFSCFFRECSKSPPQQTSSCKTYEIWGISCVTTEL